MRDLNELRRLAERADAVAPTGWEADRERMTDAPDKHHEFFAIDGAGNRMFGTENADAAFGLIEVEDDGDGFTSAWNENSRRVIEFAVAAQPRAVLALLNRLERAEAEAASLRSLLAEAGKVIEPFSEFSASLDREYADHDDCIVINDQGCKTCTFGTFRAASDLSTRIEKEIGK